MAISAAAVWEVWSTGNDTNGGGFITGASGTDYSQQASAQVTYTDLVIGGSGNENKLTSAGNSFTSAHVGNIINITSGTGFTTGRYQVVSVTTGTATMDRTVGTASSSGGNGKLGGALATVATGLQQSSLGGMICYVKATATYQITTAITPATSNDSGLTTPIRLIGYTSTRGDGGPATVQLNANSISLCTWNTNAVNCCYSWENFIFDGNSKTTVNGFNLSGTSGKLNFFNCIFKRFTDQYCVRVGSGQALALSCDFTDNAFTSGTSGGCMYTNTAGASVIMTRCYVANNSNSNNTYAAMRIASGSYVCADNVIYNNSGAGPAFNGIYCDSFYAGYVAGNIFHSNKNNGVDVLTPSGVLHNNICTSNTGVGIEVNGSGTYVNVRDNAYYNNSGGGFSGGTDVGGVTLSGLPYTNVASDFSLNATAGAGAACRAAGLPGTIGVASVVGTGYRDIGPLQHQDPATPTSAYTFVS